MLTDECEWTRIGCLFENVCILLGPGAVIGKKRL